MPKTPTRNLTINIGTDLYAAAQKAAAQAGAEAGRPVSLAEWVRRAIAEQVKREKT